MNPEIETLTKKYWDRKWAKFLKHQGLIAPSGKLIQHMLPYIPRGGYVADLGCGEGRNTMYLSQIGYKAFGIDISAKAVQALQDTLFEEEVKGSGLVGDVRMLPFCSESFHGALSHSVFDHLDAEGFAKSISETYRVLKPLGVLLMTFDKFPEQTAYKRGTKNEVVVKEDGSRISISGADKGLLFRPYQEKELSSLANQGWKVLKSELSPRRNSKILLLQKLPSND